MTETPHRVEANPLEIKLDSLREVLAPHIEALTFTMFEYGQDGQKETTTPYKFWERRNKPIAEIDLDDYNNKGTMIYGINLKDIHQVEPLSLAFERGEIKQVEWYGAWGHGHGEGGIFRFYLESDKLEELEKKHNIKRWKPK